MISKIYSGIYGRGSLVDLRLNRLSRFESNVFLPILQQMAPFPGTVIDQTYISVNLSKSSLIIFSQSVYLI